MAAQRIDAPPRPLTIPAAPKPSDLMPPPAPELGASSPAIAALELHQAQAAAAMPWRVAVRLRCLEVTATTCGVRVNAKELAAWAADLERYALEGLPETPKS